MAAHKKSREYFIQRICEFQKKLGRVPRSGEVNGKFHRNTVKIFGSWHNAVKEALGVELSHERKSNDELLQPLREYYKEHRTIPPLDTLPGRSKLTSAFGNYQSAVEAAVGINMKNLILTSLYNLTIGFSVDVASLTEIVAAVHSQDVLLLSETQIRGLLQLYEKSGDVIISRGDRLRLYKLSNDGKLFINNGGKNGNRSR